MGGAPAVTHSSDDTNVRVHTIPDIYNAVADAGRAWSHHPLPAAQFHLAGLKAADRRDLVGDSIDHCDDAQVTGGNPHSRVPIVVSKIVEHHQAIRSRKLQLLYSEVLRWFALIRCCLSESWTCGDYKEDCKESSQDRNKGLSRLHLGIN